MTKTQSGGNEFPLNLYKADDATVERALPATTRPIGYRDRAHGRAYGAPFVSRPRRQLTFPAVPTDSDLDRLRSETDRWGREATAWVKSTFPRKMEGVIGGKIRSRAAADGTIVFATGLDRQPDSVMIHPREPVNFLRAYVLPEEERHLADAAKGLVLAPGDVVVKCMIFDVNPGG